MDSTKKYENYIYLTICEVSIKLFEESEYSDYNDYCESLKLRMKDNTLLRKQSSNIMSIVNHLYTIYALNREESIEYIIKFLNSDKIKDFELSVRVFKIFFPHSIINK